MAEGCGVSRRLLGGAAAERPVKSGGAAPFVSTPHLPSRGLSVAVPVRDTGIPLLCALEQHVVTTLGLPDFRPASSVKQFRVALNDDASQMRLEGASSVSQIEKKGSVLLLESWVQSFA